MNNLSVIILGAGKGVRMKSKYSKLLHKIGNLEMIKHVINTALQLTARQVVAVVSEDNFQEIKGSVGDSIDLTIQHNRTGTGSATKLGFDCMANKSDNVLVMYGDVPLVNLNTYNKMIQIMDEKQSAIVILGFNVSDTSKKYGRFIIKNEEELDKITEYKDATEAERNITLCNAGIVLIKSGLLSEFLSKLTNNNASGEYYLTDIVEIARKQNLTCNYIVVQENEVMGINSREELATAEAIFQNNKRREFLNNGVTLVDPNSVYFSYDTKIGSDVVIENNVVFMPGVEIKNDVTVKAFSYLEGCVLNDNVKVGPFARIRKNTSISENSCIGNFVEIKNSEIGSSTKINHLTYVGDARIGNNTNIGAGTITCNYDGVKKSKTVIGNSNFIGSNTIFIAPITTQDNCMTAAGSVITKNINEGELSISRVAQKNLVKGYSRYKYKLSKNQ